MTVARALLMAREILSRRQIEDASIESEVLLGYALGMSRVQLYLEFDREISAADLIRFRKMLDRRLSGEPTAYITGRREFYGLEFYVDSRALIPRPETELLVEQAVCFARAGARSFADIGTGSGAIAVSLAVTVPEVHVYATDISPDALEVASANCLKHGVTGRVFLCQGDLLDPLPERVDVILANLPYVKKAELSSVNTWGYEPASALDGGPDGLDVVRRIISQVPMKLAPGGRVLLEIGCGQKHGVLDCIERLLPSAGVFSLPDLSGITRVVSFQLALSR